MGRHKKQTNMYLTSQQLSEALIESQQLKRPTERVCKYFKLIAENLTHSQKFIGYSRQMKEDMVSAALVKCIKNIKNFKEQYADKSFNYYTRCVEHAFFEVIMNHYKQVNIKRDTALEYTNAIQTTNRRVAESLRKYISQFIEDE